MVRKNGPVEPLEPKNCCPKPQPVPITPLVSVKSVNGMTGDVVLKSLTFGDKVYNGSDDKVLYASDLGLGRAFVYDKQVSTTAKAIEYMENAEVGDVVYCAEDFLFYLSTGEGEYKTFMSGTSLNQYALISETGRYVEIVVDDEYKITVKLFDKNQNLLSESTVDLPIEHLVKSGYYDSATKEIVLVLYSEQEIRIPVASLVSDLATKAELTTAKEELTSNLNEHKNDSVVHITADERSTWNNKQVKLVAGANIQLDDSGNISATDTIYDDTEVRGLISTETSERESAVETLTTEVNKKSDTTYVDAELAKKQDKLTANKAIELTNNILSVKYDNDTIKVDASNQLYADVKPVLKSAITATVSVGGVSAGDTFAAGTKFEDILNKILAPEKKLTSIEITTPPTKVSYLVGESFSTAGMVVTANYNVGGSSVISSYTWSPSGALALTDTEITISYTEGGITKTAKQSITVKKPEVTIYYGAVTNIPSSLSGLTSKVVAMDTFLSSTGVDQNIKSGDPTTVTEQYRTVACPVGYKLSDWLNKESGISVMSASTQVVSGGYNIYYVSPPVYDEDIGGETFTFKFAEE